MSPAVVAIVLLTAASPQLTAVDLTRLGTRTAVRLITSPPVGATQVVREGAELVVRLPVRAVKDVATPPAQEPVEAIRVERDGPQTIIRIRVAAELPFETREEPGLTTILFGVDAATAAAGSEAPVPAPRPDAPDATLAAPAPTLPPELYARLFPTGTLELKPAEERQTPRGDDQPRGLLLGPVSLSPALSATWIDGDVTAIGPQPVHAHYLQLAPAMTAATALLDGQLTAGYEPRMRFFANVPQLGDTSHLLSAALQLPLGSRARLRADHRYTKATLEASVVDPGREYYFDLAPYACNQTTAALRVELGPRLFADGEAGWKRTRFDGEAGFVGYDSRTLRGGLGYDLSRDLKAVLSYAFEGIPPSPERPVVETAAHAVEARLSGPLGPLTTATLAGGYRRQTSPQASGRSRAYSGLVFAGSIRRELGRSSSLDLALNRAALLSAFETNAYYVSNSAQATLTLPLPFETWARGSGSWLRNSYPNAASAIDAPRRDSVLGFAVGLGRRLGAHASLQADYRRERRDSNVPGYDVTTSGLTVQLALGGWGAER